MPIETAPKNAGHHILLHGDGDDFTGCSFVGYWFEFGDEHGWRSMPGHKAVNPKRWAPLPKLSGTFPQAGESREAIIEALEKDIARIKVQRDNALLDMEKFMKQAVELAEALEPFAKALDSNGPLTEHANHDAYRKAAEVYRARALAAAPHRGEAHDGR